MFLLPKAAKVPPKEGLRVPKPCQLRSSNPKRPSSGMVALWYPFVLFVVLASFLFKLARNKKCNRMRLGLLGYLVDEALIGKNVLLKPASPCSLACLS